LSAPAGEKLAVQTNGSFIHSRRCAMTTTTLVCWKCGASLESEPLPLARLAECPACHADLHVCRLCEFYDPGVANSCREPIAETVNDKAHANFCGYFQPRPDAWTGSAVDPARQAKACLDSLFGETPEDEPEGIVDDAERARRRLDDLFGSDEEG